MPKLSGKRCVVTGGGRGIGQAIGERFAAEGGLVAILDVRPELAQAAVGRIREQGGRAVAVSVDVADEESVRVAMEEVEQQLGGIDVLVNNAGIDTSATVAAMSTAMWDEMIAINLRSVFLCTRAVLPGMTSRRWGRIINISSQLAQKGAAEMAHYAAAKAGVIGFTRSLAYEVAAVGVTVNAICPGPIETELFLGLPEAWRARKLRELPIGRAGRVEEIAPTAVLLASEEGSYYVGATLNPNGGDIMV